MKSRYLLIALFGFSSAAMASGNVRIAINGSGPLDLDTTQSQQLFVPTAITQKRLRMKLAQPVLCTSFSTSTIGVGVELVNPQEFFPNPLIYPSLRGLSDINYFVEDSATPPSRGLLQLSSIGTDPAVACCILTPAANALCVQGNRTQTTVIQSELFGDGFEDFIALSGPDLFVTVEAPATIAPGAALSYSIVIRNEGVGTATNARIREYFPTVASSPPALTTGSWTCSATPGSFCSTSAGTGIISAAPNERVFSVGVGGTVTFAVTRTVINTPPPSIGSQLRLNAAVFASPVAPNLDESRIGNNQADAVVTIQSNSPPAITTIGAQTINEDESSGILDFSVSDTETVAASLTVTATSSNQSLIPNGNLVLGFAPVRGNASTRTLVVTPAQDAHGSATVTVTVSDGGGASANRVFTVTVDSINDAPSFTAGPDQVFASATAAGAQNPDWATNISQCPPARPTCVANESDIGLNFQIGSLSDPLNILSGSVSINADGEMLYSLADAGGGTAPDGVACFFVTLNDGGTGVPPNANSQTQGPFKIEVGSGSGSCDTR